MDKCLIFCCYLLVLSACSVTEGLQAARQVMPIERVEFVESGEGLIEFATNSSADVGYSFYYDSGFSELPLTSLSIEVRRESGLSTCGLLFAYRDIENFYMLELSADKSYRLWKMASGSYTPLTDWVSTSYLTSKQDLIKISFDGTKIYSIYFNSSPAITFEDGSFNGGGLHYFVDVSEKESFPGRPLRVLFKKR